MSVLSNLHSLFLLFQILGHFLKDKIILSPRITALTLVKSLRADVSKYRPEVYKSEKSKILKKIHKVALGKLLT